MATHKGSEGTIKVGSNAVAELREGNGASEGQDRPAVS